MRKLRCAAIVKIRPYSFAFELRDTKIFSGTRLTFELVNGDHRSIEKTQKKNRSELLGILWTAF